jgi:hypothetical protein
MTNCSAPGRLTEHATSNHVDPERTTSHASSSSSLTRTKASSPTPDIGVLSRVAAAPPLDRLRDRAVMVQPHRRRQLIVQGLSQEVVPESEAGRRSRRRGDYPGRDRGIKPSGDILRGSTGGVGQEVQVCVAADHGGQLEDSTRVHRERRQPPVDDLAGLAGNALQAAAGLDQPHHLGQVQRIAVSAPVDLGVMGRSKIGAEPQLQVAIDVAVRQTRD